MFNKYDMKTVHVQDNSFLQIQADLTTPTPSLTKMNIIIPIIPEPARNIMDLALLVAGISLNTFLGLFIILNSTMHTSTNYYIVGLLLSNLVILLEPLERVLDWLFDVHLEMNLDYVFFMSFATSILTMILLHVETYVVICQRNSPLRESLLKNSTAMKGIVFIWAMCVLATAMELHLYDHFEKEVMYDIYASSTIMFLIFPCFLFILLDYFILYDLIITKLTTGAWPSNEIKRFIFPVSVHIGFFPIMVPYRIVRAIALVTQSFHNNMLIEITYTMVKTYPTILPMICFAIWKKFHRVSRDKTALSIA